MAVTKKQQVNIVHHWHCWATTHCGVWLTSTGPESRLGPKLMTLPESQISMHTLIQAYESQGRFKNQENKQTKNKNKKTIKNTKKDATGGLLSMPALKASLRHST